MKARIISFFEVEDRIKEAAIELERRPMDDELVIEKAVAFSFLLGLCISQMKAADSVHYPGKTKHLKILKKASDAITYKINTCTIEEAKVQINKAYMAFGTQ